MALEVDLLVISLSQTYKNMLIYNKLVFKWEANHNN